MAEFIHQGLERDTILKGDGSHRRDGVHQSRNRAPLLRHLQEDFTGLSLFVQANREIPLVARDRELMRKRLALIRQLAPAGAVLVELRNVPALLFTRIQGLSSLASVAIYRQRLQAEFPTLNVGLHDVIYRCCLRKIHRFADCAREEGLNRPHHPQMPHPADGALAILRSKGTIENLDVLFLQIRRAFDRFSLVQEGEDRLDLFGSIANLAKRHTDRLIGDLQKPSTDQLLVLDQRDVRLHPRRIAIHHEGDRSSGRKNGHLRVLVSVLPTFLECRIPNPARGLQEVPTHPFAINLVRCVPMHANHFEEGLAVHPVTREWSHGVGDLRAHQVGLPTHQ